MLYEFTGVCQNCGSEVTIRINQGELLENCAKCESQPFALRRFKGLVYIVSNPNQVGVKIGLTEKTLEQRLKSLNSTGVAGKFAPIAIFPSDRPKIDEKKCHEKFKRKNISKEHFDLGPVEAVLGCYRALNRRQPIFFDPNLEEEFNLKLDAARIQMQLKLMKTKKK